VLLWADIASVAKQNNMVSLHDFFKKLFEVVKQKTRLKHLGILPVRRDVATQQLQLCEAELKKAQDEIAALHRDAALLTRLLHSMR
jgi:hypothetical protein